MSDLILPDWYTSGNKTAHSGSHKRSGAIGVIRRALGAFGEAIAIQLSGVQIPRSQLSELNPSMKFIGILALIIAATVIHSPALLIIMLAAGIAATLLARIDNKRILRIWLGVPLFSLAVILPSVLNIITPGSVVIPLWKMNPHVSIFGWNPPSVIGITMPGIRVAARFMLRVMSCVTFAFLLTATTDQRELIAGLRRLGLPKVFGMTLGMMQRYLTVMLRSAEEIHLAKLSRTIESASTLHEQKWAAAGIGALFRKTHRFAEEVHNAMISRGYDGDFKSRVKISTHASDYVWVGMCLIVSISAVILDRMVL